MVKTALPLIGYGFNPWLGKFHVPHNVAKKKINFKKIQEKKKEIYSLRVLEVRSPNSRPQQSHRTSRRESIICLCQLPVAVGIS